MRGVGDTVEAPRDAERPAEALRGLDDTRLDHHLRLRDVEGFDDRDDGVDVGRELLDDQRVGARVDGDRAALRQDARSAAAARGEDARQIRGARVADALDHRAQRNRQRLGLGQGLLFLGFGLENVARGDAHDVAVELIAEVVDLQDLVECLVPGHTFELDRDGAAHAGLENDVQSADLGERSQHVLDVAVLEAERDRLADVFLVGSADVLLREGRAGRNRRPGRLVGLHVRRFEEAAVARRHRPRLRGDGGGSGGRGRGRPGG